MTVKRYTLPDDIDSMPLPVFLRLTRSQWVQNPLHLANMPGVTDPRCDQWQALDDAFRLIDDYEKQLIVQFTQIERAA